jgi:uncharacterized RDD family membrane protein YckC
VEPLREIPGLRKRERTWRDEVRERVRQRRQERHGGVELPLFPAADAAAPDETPAAPDAPAPASAPAAPPEPVGDVGGSPAAEPSAPPAIDLPLRPPPLEAPLVEVGTRTAAASSGPALGEPEPEPEWRLELTAEPEAPRALERPARPRERALAALADLGLLAVLWGTVVYFTGRALRVEPWGLLPAWPALAAYLAGLGLAYAAYFTGTTGQTPGKMALGLRVVDRAGRPPGYAVALLRCALGVAGAVLVAGLVPVLVDPARRALHDRMFRTRVVRH